MVEAPLPPGTPPQGNGRVFACPSPNFTELFMTCKCGRDFEPKQAWIHLPLCRYVDEVSPNHVPFDKREKLTTPVNTAAVNTVVNTLDASESRKAYMREYMKRKRAQA